MTKSIKIFISFVALSIFITFVIYKVINKNIVHNDTLILINRNITEKSFLDNLDKKNIKINRLEWMLGKFFFEKKFVLKYGEYLIKKNTKLKDFLYQIHNSRVYYRKFILIDGTTSKDLKINLSKAIGLVGKVPKLHEGIYKPDTYLYKWGDTKTSLLREMERKQKKILNYYWKKRKKNFVIKSKIDILVLASIVQKEGKKIDELKNIASVFFNRIKKNMKLQSDSTVAFGLSKKGNELNRSDLRSNNIYNTYKYYGLPPTPISYPSENSIIAVIEPNQTDFLYFVSDGEGGHRFSNNYTQHKKNIKLWLKKLENDNGK